MLRFGKIENVLPIELAGQPVPERGKYMAGMVLSLPDGDGIGVRQREIAFQQIFYADPPQTGFYSRLLLAELIKLNVYIYSLLNIQQISRHKNKNATDRNLWRLR